MFVSPQPVNVFADSVLVPVFLLAFELADQANDAAKAVVISRPVIPQPFA
jgi:hypothetical protein